MCSSGNRSISSTDQMGELENVSRIRGEAQLGGVSGHSARRGHAGPRTRGTVAISRARGVPGILLTLVRLTLELVSPQPTAHREASPFPLEELLHPWFLSYNCSQTVHFTDALWLSVLCPISNTVYLKATSFFTMNKEVFVKHGDVMMLANDPDTTLDEAYEA
ncbi:hypothetical protein CB1_064113031 [Camelus ferus]|nr:hypothetical protein CB1_064113031 [Camelus ferus]